MENGKVITSSGESEVIIKKSRFLGLAAAVSTEDEARDLVGSIRKKYYDARHVCYAYSIGEDNPRLKFSDDGEPGGTAGKPILAVISNSGIHNIVIIVTRYFGGVLLGTGGLVRAYTEAAAEAVKNAGVKEVCLNRIYDIIIEYGDFDKIKYLLDGTEGAGYTVDYTEKVVLHLSIPDTAADKVVEAITEKTAGKATVSLLDKKVM